MDALAFLPAPEVAARVRDGSVSAREVVEASIRRIEALDPQLGAFIELDAERALAEADTIGAGDPRAFAGVPIAVKANTPIVAAPADAQRAWCGGSATRGWSCWARRRCPSSATADDRAAPHRADAQPVGPDADARRLLRRLRGGGRGGHGPGRPRQRRRRLDPHPRRLLRPRRPEAEPRPDLARARPRRLLPRRGRRALAHGGRDRAAARRDGGLRAGRRELGAAAGRAVHARDAARAGTLRIAMSLDNALGAESTPRSCAASTTRRRCCASSGTRSWRRARPARPDRSTSSSRSSARWSRSGSASASGSPGGRRARTRSSRCRARSSSTLQLSSTGYLTAVAQLQVLARGMVAFFADYDLLLTPVLAARPLPIGELDGCGGSRWPTCAAPAASRPFTALFNVTGQPAISLPAASGRTACRAGSSSSATRWRRRRCCRSRRSSEAARPWAGRRPAMADGA